MMQQGKAARIDASFSSSDSVFALLAASVLPSQRLRRGGTKAVRAKMLVTEKIRARHTKLKEMREHRKRHDFQGDE